MSTGNDQLILIDSHAHLEMNPLYSKVESVISRARAAGVKAIITVGIDLEDVERAIELTNRFENVYASIGFHPHNVEGVYDTQLEKMRSFAECEKVVGFGEIGLDFFRNWSPQADQRRVFREQLRIAKELNKPVVIHLRDAYTEGLATLEQEGPYPAGGVIHCFSGTLDDAQRALNLGFYISVPGTVTYKKNDILRGIVRKIPSNRIILETDCPFLAPEPLRGKDNEPANMVHTAKRVAEIKDIILGELCLITSRNAIRLFGLPEDILTK